jgi:hypothetical protein
MPKLIEQCMDTMDYIANPTLNELIETNLSTRKYALKLTGSLSA